MTVEKKDQNSPITYYINPSRRHDLPPILEIIIRNIAKKIRTFPKFSQNFHCQIMFYAKNIEFAHHEKYKRLQREKYESLSFKISPSIWPDYYNGTRKKYNYIQPPRCYLETKSLMT